MFNRTYLYFFLLFLFVFIFEFNHTSSFAADDNSDMEAGSIIRQHPERSSSQTEYGSDDEYDADGERDPADLYGNPSLVDPDKFSYDRKRKSTLTKEKLAKFDEAIAAMPTDNTPVILPRKKTKTKY
jgi:hypothetical protein